MGSGIDERARAEVFDGRRCSRLAGFGRWAGIVVLGGLATGARGAATATSGPEATASEETVGQAICRLIEASARDRSLPVDFFTRLIWRESSFCKDAVSHAGALGIAQFMPGTARECGLADPFDPEAAIPASASLLSDLRPEFGNLGLAAAAYNAGPGRVRAWLDGRSGLPAETIAYVARITARAAEDWAAARRTGRDDEPRTGPTRDGDASIADRTQAAPSDGDRRERDLPRTGGPTPAAREGPSGKGPEPRGNAEMESCLPTLALLGRPDRARHAAGPALPLPAIFVPWGVQVSGNFSKSVALASFQRARTRHRDVFGGLQPMVIGTRMSGRGARPCYRVRLPAETRAAADRLCDRLRAGDGACIVLKT